MPEPGQIGIYFDSGGYRLLGTLFLARGPGPKPTALLLHGVPGIEKNYDLAHMLRQRGWNSLIFHFRGSWGSQGPYAFQTQPADVRAAVDYLASGRHSQVDPQRLVAIGHSLGGWAAVLAAVDDPRLRAVATIAAVTEPRALTWSRETILAEFTPWLQGITPEGFAQRWAALDATWSPVEQVARLAPRPLLILHGARDDEVPVTQARMLYEGARHPRELIVHPTAGHSFVWQRPWLRDQVWDWLCGLGWER